MSMNILMIARSTLYSSPGGDTVQIEMTAKYLRYLGVNVEIKLSHQKIDYQEFDLIHFFNIIRPDDILPHMSKTDLPFVVSTIFVDYEEYERSCRKGPLNLLSKIFSSDQLEYLKTLARSVKNRQSINSWNYIFKGHKASIKYIAEKSSLLLPNSDSEYLRFNKKYQIHSPYKKVVNAIDPITFHESIEPHENFRDHVLCVGRIEGRKNQLNLIKALSNTGLQLTIIGKPSPNHSSYYNECRKLASLTKNIHFIEHIDHTQLVSIYKAAKVHVLPSWFETTGLSSLEAGAMNCNLVVTKKGDTEEYFQDLVYYCQPDCTNSIRESVFAAYNSPINRHLSSMIKKTYTWNRCAHETFDAYTIALKEHANVYKYK